MVHVRVTGSWPHEFLNALLTCPKLQLKSGAEFETLPLPLDGITGSDRTVVLRDREPAVRLYLDLVWQRYHEPFVRLLAFTVHFLIA